MFAVAKDSISISICIIDAADAHDASFVQSTAVFCILVPHSQLAIKAIITQRGLPILGLAPALPTPWYSRQQFYAVPVFAKWQHCDQYWCKHEAKCKKTEQKKYRHSKEMPSRKITVIAPVATAKRQHFKTHRLLQQSKKNAVTERQNAVTNKKMLSCKLKKCKHLHVFRQVTANSSVTVYILSCTFPA